MKKMSYKVLDENICMDLCGYDLIRSLQTEEDSDGTLLPECTSGGSSVIKQRVIH